MAPGIVVLTPALDDCPGLGEAIEQLAVQKLVTKLRVKALAVAVLPRTARLNKRRFRVDRHDPLLHRLRDELGTVVRTNMPRHATQDEEIGQDIDDVGGLEFPVDPDRDAFPGELVDHVQHAELPTVVGAILDEVVGPDMIGMLRPKPDARSVIEPETGFLRLPGRHLQPLLTPDPLNALDVHRPASGLQHGRDSAVAIAAITGGELDNVGGQRRIVSAALRNLALRRSMLPQNPACQPLRHVELLDDLVDAATAPGGAR